ncbi:MAG: type II toxin-antitoxin system PemK/MazF family toxin [Deltaproteobacteria bacterium]|nr:type II toxin-antitoxin system PemK/MazF family toxin [Deltaproteobacteria bacterium]
MNAIVAERGDVMVRKRRLGFGASGRADRVVVVQPACLNAVLPTTVVVPLEVGRSSYGVQSRDVPVSAAEAGADRAHIAIVTLVSSASLDRLEPGAVGRLSAFTLAKIDRVLRIVLGLA